MARAVRWGAVLTALLVLASVLSVQGEAQSETQDEPGAPHARPSRVAADSAVGSGAITTAVTVADLVRHLAVLTHDSMRAGGAGAPGISGARGDTASGLERTARYVGAQFQALGLEPASDSSWTPRYPLPRHSGVNGPGSFLAFLTKVKRGGVPVVDETGEPVGNFGMLTFADAALAATDTILDSRALRARGGGQGWILNDQSGGPPVVLVAGPHTTESLRQAGLQDRVVVYVPAPSADSAQQRQVVEQLRVANHVIIVVDEDSAAWAARRRRAEARPAVVLDWYLPEAEPLRRWAIYVRASAIAGRLGIAGADLPTTRMSATPVVRELNALALLWMRPAAVPTGPTLPNAVGVLRGSEPGQVVVITTHLSHARAGGETSPTGGRAPVRDAAAGDDHGNANDHAANVAGLLALAQAFKQAGVLPRRTVVFAAVSGGGAEFWGSSNLAAVTERLPMLAGGTVVANLTFDRLGRGARDSLFIHGLGEVELPVPPAWLAAQQPELRLAVIDGGSVVAPVSDHYPFVRQAVPSLYLHGAGADTTGVVDTDQVARAVGLVGALAWAIADAPRAPRWTAAGRTQRSRVFGQER